MAKKTKSKRLTWIFIVAGILIAAGLVYWYFNTKSEYSVSTKASSKNELTTDLLRANKLTQDVFYYVEQVEMKKMTQQEADKLSYPIKRELQNIRAQLSKEELTYNDSIRKVLGNIMVDNVMKWRKDNGLLVPEDSISMESGN